MPAPSDGGVNPSKPFDLEERTAQFGEAVIRFCKVLPHTVITEPLIRQIVKSATSVGRELLRGGRRDLQEGIPAEDRDVQEGIAGKPSTGVE